MHPGQRAAGEVEVEALAEAEEVARRRGPLTTGSPLPTWRSATCGLSSTMSTDHRGERLAVAVARVLLRLEHDDRRVPLGEFLRRRVAGFAVLGPAGVANAIVAIRPARSDATTAALVFT